MRMPQPLGICDVECESSEALGSSFIRKMTRCADLRLTAGIRDDFDGEEDKDFALVSLVDLSKIESEEDETLEDFLALVTDGGERVCFAFPAASKDPPAFFRPKV